MRVNAWQPPRSETLEAKHNPVQTSYLDWINTSSLRLSASSESPRLDAQVLLAKVLGVRRSFVIAHPENILKTSQMEELETHLKRLEQGEPLPYVLGEWEFYGLKFNLSPAVLIPRPETELLVETALGWLSEHPQRRFGLDVGTGSACIAIALAANCSDLRLLASDIYAGALRVGRRNILRHGLEKRIELVQADLVPPVNRSYDLICANLPYIPSQTLDQLKVGRWEPTVALDGGVDGLEVVRRLLTAAALCLAPGGFLLCEIEAGQGQTALLAAQKTLPFAEIRLLTDLSGRDRLLTVQT